MTEMWIAEDVENYFAASPIGPLLEVGHVAHAYDHPISQAIRKSFELVPEEVLSSVLADDQFRCQYSHVDDEKLEWFAREWSVIEELNKRIRQRRRACLLSQNVNARTAPYDEVKLADLTVSADDLVPLSEFAVEESVLLRNGRAYSILPPTPSENSAYWITRALLSSGFQNRAWVRLDPLIRGPANDFPRMGYRMLWWGPPLLWEDIGNVQEEGFGRWVPSSLGSRSEFTDYAWVPRGDELHLFLEEMPKRDDVDIAGSRYFHVIFSHVSKQVVHLDGAMRIYSAIEWDQRKNVHVHRTGKVGKRIKVFRIDGPLPPDAVSILGGTYFVWNFDVSNFFGASIPELLLGQAG